MRPIMAFMLTILLFAGVYGYTQFTKSVRRPPLEIVPEFSTGQYRLVVSRTFDCVGDSGFDTPALLLRFRGEEIWNVSESLKSTEPLEINPLGNVEVGANELFVMANVDSNFDAWDAPEAAQNALRVQVFDNARLVAEQSFWQESGSNTVGGVVSFRGSLNAILASQADGQEP